MNTVPREVPVFSPEILDQVFSYLARGDLCRLARVSRFFLQIARRLLMATITVEPRNLDVCQQYVTTLVECKAKPPMRALIFDVAISMWQILYIVDKACSAETTRSLVVNSSIRFADWQVLSTMFRKHLVAMLPNIHTMHLKPLESKFQFSLLSTYSSTLVKLTIHSAIAKSSVGWARVAFPKLEHVEIIQDHAPLPHEDTLPMLMAKFVEAPELKHASIVAITEGRIVGVFELLLAFAKTLDSVKILGDFTSGEQESRLLPKLPFVTCLHIELELVPFMFQYGDYTSSYLPLLQRLVMEGDWTDMDSGCSEVRWDRIHRMLTRIAEISPKPTIVCGYRGNAVLPQRKIFTRILTQQLLDAAVWNVREVFEVDEVRCDVLPPCRPAYTDGGKPRLRNIPAVKTRRFSDSPISSE